MRHRQLGTHSLPLSVFSLAIVLILTAGCDALVDKIDRLLSTPNVILDEYIVVDAQRHYKQEFMLSESHPLLVEAIGSTGTEDGFAVHIMEKSEWKNFLSRKTTQYYHFPVFYAKQVTGYHRKGQLPEGEYLLVVSNLTNLLDPMHVHTRIVTDPEE